MHFDTKALIHYPKICMTPTTYSCFDFIQGRMQMMTTTTMYQTWWKISTRPARMKLLLHQNRMKVMRQNLSRQQKKKNLQLKVWWKISTRPARIKLLLRQTRMRVMRQNLSCQQKTKSDLIH